MPGFNRTANLAYFCITQVDIEIKRLNLAQSRVRQSRHHHSLRAIAIIGRTFQYKVLEVRKAFFWFRGNFCGGEGKPRRQNVSYIENWPVKHLNSKLL
jgi:hypothetical protein